MEKTKLTFWPAQYLMPLDYTLKSGYSDKLLCYVLYFTTVNIHTQLLDSTILVIKNTWRFLKML